MRWPRRSAEDRASLPRVIGGRYGLSKEFNPACVQAIFDELALDNPLPRFTVGIFDDVTGLSLPLPTLDPGIGNQHKLEALFYGLGSDGTVSAAKNSIKILGNHTDLYPQGYFVYDSKKAGGLTVSHLRVGEQPLQSAYLVDEADFIGCHQWQFIDMYQMAERLRPDGIFLLNTPTTPIRSGSGCPRRCNRPCSRSVRASTPSTPPKLPASASSATASIP